MDWFENVKAFMEAQNPGQPSAWASQRGFGELERRITTGTATPQDLQFMGQISSVGPEAGAQAMWNDFVARVQDHEAGSGGIFGINELSTGIPALDNTASMLLGNSVGGQTGYNIATGKDVQQGVATDVAGLAAGAGLAQVLPATGLSTVAGAGADATIGSSIGGAVTPEIGYGAAGPALDYSPAAIAKVLADPALAVTAGAAGGLTIGEALGGTAAAKTISGTGGEGGVQATTPTGTTVGQPDPNTDPNTHLEGGNEGGNQGGGTVTSGGGGTVDVGMAKTINDLINGVTGGDTDWSSLMTKYGPALVGGLIGATQNKTAPIQQTPWNSQYFGPLQDATAKAMTTNNLQLPEVPQMQQIPDIANDQAANAYADAVVKKMRQSFSDPGGPLSMIRSDFTADQPGGGTRQGLAEGVAAGRQMDAEGLARAQIMNAIYPTNLQFNANRVQQNNANDQWSFGQNTGRNTALWQAPWQNLAQAGNIFTGAAGKGTTTVLPQTPWWQSGLGGALATQGVVNKIGGA